ncbi:MAG: N-6 DNA methylase [Deltaproteobacteria bacterium]|nr:N-6 DNA methylase [Deltaproteobacteria bacterium]
MELVDKFAIHVDDYKKGHYNEAQVRREYIDPFFEALGWDIENEDGYAEQYKDVIHEDSLKVGVSMKAPDYSFRIGGVRKFFLEAKKPAVKIKTDSDPAFQLRRYGWSAKLSLSILTDFEEFAVYDCRIKPSEKDKVGLGRIRYLTYEDYVKEFDYIYDTFSKEAILRGSFDRYIETSKKHRGTSEVDSEFLKIIEEFRLTLAKKIASGNKTKNLSVHDLNFAVQQTLDRIIFLRICEDKGIEPYGQLQALLNGENIYQRLFEVFYKADVKYNSGLFDFKSDTFTHTLEVDNKILKEIISNLYAPKSPYEFSVLGVDILGNVYEQFLGKVITLSPSGKTAKVEEKPEVKKAGGVYYTPQYIVEYIVKNTIGELLNKKTPKEALKLKILDPACGSGSFLIGAYDYLLKWHLKWYCDNDPEKHCKGKDPKIFKIGVNSYRLTASVKKQILTNNIHGVDIDRQAVEVAKLSLLLKVLEDENGETLARSKLNFRERVLPNLKDNIKCGNSLIGSDFYNQLEFDMKLDDEEARRINVFDWDDDKKGFGKIMKAGGFDCVIGNPPYGATLSIQEKNYLKTYKAYEYQLNSFVLFIEKGLQLLSKNGFSSYITPAVFLSQHYFKNIRNLILKKYCVRKILLLNYKVFQEADTGDTTIFTIQNTFSKNTSIKNVTLKSPEDFLNNLIFKTIPQDDCLNNKRYELNVGLTCDIMNKINGVSITLGNISKNTVGIKPYQKGKGKPKQNERIVKDRIYDSETAVDSTYKQYLIGKDIDKYKVSILANRFIKYGKNLAEPRQSAPFESKKIILRQTSDIIRAVIDDNNYYNLNNIYNIEITNNNYSYEYLLGILNSKSMIYIYQNIVPEKGKVFAEVKKINLKKLPIRTIDLSNKTEKAVHDKMVSLVNTMLELNKKLAKTKIPHERDLTERRISATDTQIDTLVYELYGLTKEEIKIVEGD